ncbi:MAG: hypothetical protein IPG50_17695 [Myxococcales bacterium]|nr:hypothetical protein [Myxococcales bacterium]
MTRIPALAPFILLVACGGSSPEEGAPSDTEQALQQGSNTVLQSPADKNGVSAEFKFRIEATGEKRVARVSASRGAATADLACTQLTNIHTTPSEDEVVTTCEEQIQPGYEYVSVYFRFRPSSKRFTYDVIASHPTKLTQHQRELYQLFAGKDVESLPPEPPGQRYVSHREEADKLTLRTKTRATDPFSDPIALASAVHDGMRGPLGATAKDREKGVDYTVERVTTYTDFETLVYSVHVQGRNAGADVRWHSNYSMKVSVLASPGALRSTDEIATALKGLVAAF